MKLVNKGRYAFDTFRHGLVFDDVDDPTKEGLHPDILSVDCPRNKEGRRDYHCSAVPNISQKWFFAWKLEDQKENDFTIQSARLPIICRCVQCKQLNFTECLEVARGEEAHDVSTFNMKLLPMVEKQQGKTERKPQKFPVKLLNKIVVVQEIDGGFELGVVVEEEKMTKKKTAVVTDLTPGAERALLVSPHGFVVEQGETKLVVAMFHPPLGEGNDFSKINRRTASRVQIVRQAVCGIVVEGDVTWKGERKEAFTLSDKVIEKMTDLVSVNTKAGNVGCETESEE